MRDDRVLEEEAVLVDSLPLSVDSQVMVPVQVDRQQPALLNSQVDVLADVLDEDSNIGVGTQNPLNPLAWVLDSNPVHQLGQNQRQGASEDFTVSMRHWHSVFPPASSASSQADSVLPSFPLSRSVILPALPTGGRFAESPHTLSNLLSHSPISSSCPPLSDFSSTFSPTSDLHTPNLNFTQLVARTASRPLKVAPASSPLLRCHFIGCTFSCGRPLDLTHHQNTLHKFRCLLGCLRSFTTRRRQAQHHESESHRAPGLTTSQYQCGGCGKSTPATRRDNYWRHLRNCKKQSMAPYVCHCGHPPTSDKQEHMRHVDSCKGKAGRPRGSKYLSGSDD